MTLKESFYVGLAVFGTLAIYLFIRDSKVRDTMLLLLRKKQVADLSEKIRREAAEITAEVGFTERRLQEEAENYRARKLDESPEAIRAYYEKFFNQSHK